MFDSQIFFIFSWFSLFYEIIFEISEVRIHAKYVTNQYIKQISKMWRQWTKPESKDNHFVYLLENAHIGSTFSDLESPNLSYKILQHFLYL